MKTTDFLNELSSEKLAQYKEKARKSADELSAAGKHRQATDRWGNVMRATGKQIEKTTDAIRKSSAIKEGVNIVENNFDDFAAMVKQKFPGARVRGTPDQERQRTQDMIAQRKAQASNRPAVAPLSPEVRAKLEAELKKLQAQFDPNYQYSDDHSVWTRNHEIAQQIGSIRSRLKQGVAEGFDRLDDFTRKVLNRMEDDSWLSAERAYFIQKGAQEKAQRNRDEYNQEIQRFIDLYRQYKGQQGVAEDAGSSLSITFTPDDIEVIEDTIRIVKNVPILQNILSEYEKVAGIDHISDATIPLSLSDADYTAIKKIQQKYGRRLDQTGIYEHIVNEYLDSTKQGVAEGIYQGQFKTKEQAIAYAKTVKHRDPDDGIEIWAMPSGGFDVVHTMNSNGRNHVIQNGGKKLGTIGPRHKGVAEGQLEFNTPNPVVVIADAKTGNILDTMNLSVAAQKYQLGNPENIKQQLAHQAWTTIGKYRIQSPFGQPQDATTQGMAEGWKDKLAGAALAGSMALGGGAQAQTAPAADQGHSTSIAQHVAQQKDLGNGFMLTSYNIGTKVVPAIQDTQDGSYIIINNGLFRTPAKYISINSDGKMTPTMAVGPDTAAALAKAGLMNESKKLKEDAGATCSSSIASVVSEFGDEMFTRRALEKKLSGYSNRLTNVKKVK